MRNSCQDSAMRPYGTCCNRLWPTTHAPRSSSVYAASPSSSRKVGTMSIVDTTLSRFQSGASHEKCHRLVLSPLTSTCTAAAMRIRVHVCIRRLPVPIFDWRGTYNKENFSPYCSSYRFISIYIKRPLLLCMHGTPSCFGVKSTTQNPCLIP